MQKIDTKKIAEGVKTLIEKRSTLKQMKGITNEELEAVYTLAFGSTTSTLSTGWASARCSRS